MIFVLKILSIKLKKKLTFEIKILPKRGNMVSCVDLKKEHIRYEEK